jgi:hypothetical protein
VVRVTPLDTDALRTFLLKSNAAGYSGGDEKTWTREEDGSLTITFEDGVWKSHDNFFGGEPYGGRTVVFLKDHPVWMLVYYGWVDESADPDRLYAVLKNALNRMPAEAPYRGPAQYIEDRLVYTNSWEGKLEQFFGREEMAEGSMLLYRAEYAGGLVDRRKAV